MNYSAEYLFQAKKKRLYAVVRMPRLILVLLCFTFCIGATAQKRLLLKDIYFDPANLRLGNAFLNIQLSKTTGDLLQIQTAQGSNLIHAKQTSVVDLEIDGKKRLKWGTIRLVRYTLKMGPASVALLIEQLADGYTDTIQTAYILYPNKGQLERAVSVHAATEGVRKFTGFYFNLPGLRIGEKKDCFANVPGPFWPATLTAADTPYDSLVNKTIHYHSAPDGGFGIFSVTNLKQRQTATIFMKTNGDVNTATSLYGNGVTFDLEQKNNKALYLKKGNTVTSDTQCILITKTFAEGLAQYRKMAAQRMPLAQSTPKWVKEAVILEILPSYFKGGFKEITQKLSFYKDVGFNTIYVMPHWKGGYSPIDLYQVDSTYGTKEDLQQLVHTAHQLGMKVLFDMVIHGFHTASPVVQQHPEFFFRDERDSLMIHPAWGSVMTDFMNPAYQQYMKAYVLHDQKTFGMDGYRVDAASYKGSNWKKDLPYPAYKSGTASPLLMQLMLDAIRQKNREAVLLSEVFGPVFYTVSNFGHDNQTEAMSYVLKQIEKRTYTLAQYKKHLQYVYGSLPEGAVRVFYTRNHDTSWFYEFYGYSPLFLTLEAIHAFFGVPEVFAGDANYKFNPDDDRATYGYYKKLFAARKQYPEFAHGTKNFDAVSCNEADVFAALAEDSKQSSVFIASGAQQAKKVNVTIAPRYLTGGIPVATDIIRQTSVPLMKTKKGFTLTLQPNQVVVIRLQQ